MSPFIIYFLTENVLLQEECMQRCKYLSDMVRKMKQKEEEDEQSKEEDGHSETELPNHSETS